MARSRRLALLAALLATGCVNGTQGVDSLNTGADRLANDKPNEKAVLRIADATRAGGDPGTAINLYRRAHQLEPKDPVPLARLGATLADQQAYTEASEAYRQALALAPDDADIERGFASVLLAVDQPELALTHLNAALAHKKDPKIYSLIGVANDLLGRYGVAQRAYAQGLELAPDNLALRNNLGLSQALAGNFAEATTTLSAAAASPDATARMRQNLALAYGLAGDTEKAAAIARRDLDEQSVKNNIAYYAMLRGLDPRARAAAIIGAHAPAHGTNGEATTADAAKPNTSADAKPDPSMGTAPPPNRAVVDSAPLPAPSAPSDAPAATPKPPRVVKVSHATPTASAETAPTPTKIAATAPQPAAPAAPPSSTAAPAASPAETADAPQASLAAASPIAAAAPATPAPAAAAAAPARIAATETAAATPGHDAGAPAAEPDAATPAEAKAMPQVADAEPAAEASAATAVKAKAPRRGRRFIVQIGAFHDQERAKKLCADLAGKGFDLAVTTGHGGGGQDWYFCRSTAAFAKDEATALAQRLHDATSTMPTLIPAPSSLAAAG
ncbi:MAG TPA: tetratricopeptide repeat protein [Stellaceae bacterium]|nr:tetratricopeptide repeat protein [Stellaceae bacterium]